MLAGRSLVKIIGILLVISIVLVFFVLSTLYNSLDKKIIPPKAKIVELCYEYRKG